MELTPDLITQFGLIQKVSTGHPYLDMIIVMLVPLIIRNIFPVVQNWIAEIMKDRTPAEVFERQIEHRKNYEYWWSNDDDGPSNTILQKAVINFINSKTDILRELPKADFQLKKKAVEHKKNMTGEDEEDPDTNINEHTYDVNVVPQLGVWVDLKNGIKFMRQMEESDGEGKKRTSKVITYFLRAEGDDPSTEDKVKDGNSSLKKKKKKTLEEERLEGIQRIEAFITEALELYRKQQAQKIDYSRYFYVPVLSGFAARAASDEEGSKAPSAIYKRYKLSEEKTFASFFHPDKDAILSLVNQFTEKRGKFSIPGYPQKLGFLLYGPPGTGKTSFIKALAQFTKRSIISIPLTKIQTNQELMDIMFDQKIKCDGEEVFALPYNKTIFVMEDVDAASTVVQRRAEVGTDSDMKAAALLAAVASASSKKSRRNKKKKADAATGNDAGDKEGDGGEKDTAEAAGSGGKDSDSESERGKKKGRAFGPMPAFGRSLFGGDDDLNLAGLLNVLDGVVDTPNRIVIMTTNHPEKLDPALIRPGRINKKIYMGRICTEQAIQMMGHYFGAASETTKAQLRGIFVDEALSPAELETACADFDTAEELVDNLAMKFLAADRIAQEAAAVGVDGGSTLMTQTSYARHA